MLKTAQGLWLLVLLVPLILFPPLTFATVDPLSVPNNRFGIHIISASPDEVKDTAGLANTNGDWGYITFLIESGQRDKDRWQTFFNQLRVQHLIPIVRIATKSENGYWARPYDKEEDAWADFLDSLNWPTKNRYVVVYNEPNHATEWGNTVDPITYAQTLDKTIDALKAKNPDFFVLNAGLDASAPDKMPAYMDSFDFMEQMDKAVPGIFNKLDGWDSHSYPNPNFSGPPTATGKGTVDTFETELKELKQLGVTKDLPIFITETGWKHAEGKVNNRAYPSSDTVADYYQKAFTGVWNNPNIAAVTPFVMDYQDAPFDNFSFKKIAQVITQSPNPDDEASKFYPAYTTLKNLPKTSGRPIQENRAKLEKGGLSDQNITSIIEASGSTLTTSLVAGESYNLFLTVSNNGQSIWGDNTQVSLVPQAEAAELGVPPIKLPDETRVEPGQSYTFNFQIKPLEGGHYDMKLNMYAGDKLFDSDPFDFTIDVKSPVELQVHAVLKWKTNPAGDYLLTVFGNIKNAIDRSVSQIALGNDGSSQEVEARYLLPDKDYDFTLEKPFYKPVTIHQKVLSGNNTLDFGELQPDITSAILNPSELWQLLPWSE